MRRRRTEIVGDVRLGRDVRIGEGCRLLGLGGPLIVGDGSVLGERCRLVAHERVELGPGCRLADGVVVQDFAPVYDDPERPVRLQGLRTDPVRVAEGTILGPGACLGPGARTRPGEVVGANTVLEPSRPPAGSRARRT